ncbi:MAG TPA: lipopolysaccharide heptosyltransferase II [Gemmatimonadaceae bacterium]|nr:lipopolysaccharide heptosyltransferase II [Gemmatimonadaceae bacterium]
MQASLVVQTSFLGDTVLTTPLIAELARRGPVDVVTTPAAAGLLAHSPCIRDLIPYDKRGAAAGIGGLLRLASRLRAARYDAAYLAQGSARSAALAFLARVPRRVGFDTSAGRWLYTERVAHRGDRHHAERLWRLAAGASAPDPDPEVVRPRLFPGDADRGAVDALLAAAPRDGAPLLALAPGSVWSTKRWPHFTALAARLAPLYRLAIVGSATDRPLAADLAAAVGAARVVDATGRLSLLASAELIGRCVAIVTNDSAPLHLASAMDVPTVAIFGPTVPAFGFGPLATRRAIAEHPAMPCRPCDAHGPRACPLGHWKCMRDVEPAHVFDAVLRLTPPAPR